MEQTTFTKGTTARCNRCGERHPLPKNCQGHYDHVWRGEYTVVIYRLDTMSTLDCGHMDAHWIYENK